MNAASEIHWLDALGQAELVRAGEVTPLELVNLAIERIERLDPVLRAIVYRRFARARTEAAAVPADTPFRGVPFLLKDAVVRSAGDRYQHGLAALRDHPWYSPHDSELVRRYRAAGLTVLGRTAVPELTLAVTTEPTAFGPVRNPWDLERTAGGSSGGSAAAVAAGLVPAAHGNDMGGSIRIPAACCGLVGLKPSRDRTSLAPDFGEYWGPLTSQHVLTRSVRDSAALLDATAGGMTGDLHTAAPAVRPWLDEVGRDPGLLRIGLMTVPPGGEPVDAECLRAVNQTAQLLERLGHRVEHLHGPDLFDPIGRAGMLRIVSTGAARDVDEWERRLGVSIADLEPRTAAAVELGRGTSAVDLMNATDALARWSRRIASHTARFDSILSPTMALLPPKVGEFTEHTPIASMSPVTALTVVFNVSGQPAISLPLGTTPTGLPVGVQIAAALGGEDILFRLAAQLEAAQPWNHRRPPTTTGAGI
jgi:amidase